MSLFMFLISSGTPGGNTINTIRRDPSGLGQTGVRHRRSQPLILFRAEAVTLSSAKPFSRGSTGVVGRETLAELNLT